MSEISYDNFAEKNLKLGDEQVQNISFGHKTA